MTLHRTLLSLSCLLFVACGGARHAETLTIDDVRARAESAPDDPAAQRALAEAEFLMRGGDPARVEDAFERARRLNPDDLGLVFLGAVEREMHGHPSDALDAFLDVIARSRTSADPRAAAFAQVAAAEIEGLDDAVPNFADRVAEGLGPIHAEPGGIGDGARATIADLLIDIAYRQGNVDRVAALTAAQRCGTEWRIAGPFGPRHLLGFQQALAPDTDDTLSGEYELGPARGARETRTLQARGCNVHLGGGPVAGPGTTFAETTLEIPSAGRWVLRVETPNAVQVFVDGDPVAQIDRRREPSGRASFHALDLTAGSHRVRVRVTTRHPNPVLHVSASQTAGTPGGAALSAADLTTALLEAQLAMARGDVVRARELMRTHVHEDGAPVFLIAASAATLNDPLRSGGVRHDTARRLLGWAAERDEAVWYPRLTLAQLEANEGRDVNAIEVLRASAERWPELVIFPLQLNDLLTARGWHAQADEAVANARAAVSSACRPLRAELNRARRRHRAAEALSAAQAIVACDARSDALLTLRVRRREWDAARAELARLAELEPEQSTIGELQAELEMAQARGDEAEVRRLIGALRTRIPRGDQLVLASADRQLAAGDAQSARGTLRDAMAADPQAMMGLQRVNWAVGGTMPLEAFRRDGGEVISDLEASDRQYEEPMVLVFDYTVYRVFEDGSMLELTHNIFRLQSQEAVDRMGEYAVPEGAHMLTLRTVKADGTRLEPDEIAGKDTISFPSLSPGDYIEFEYVRGHEPPAGYPGGFIGDRFYFRNYETPFDLSQLTVVTPSAMELTLDPRGEAPETELEERDGLRVHRWTARESRPFSQEPASIPAREFFPSVYWGRGADWDLYIESLRDVLADRDMRDPAAERLVAGIVGPESSTPEQRAARIYQWVLENIEDSQDVFGSAPAMVAARTGNRTRVYRYLLDMAGIEAELALARSFGADRHEGVLPDDDTYQNLVVRLRGTTGFQYTHAGARGAPFGYVPPTLQGMDALMLNEEAERVRLPEGDDAEHRRSVEVDVELQRDGDARIRVVETFRGAGAILWRNQLEGIPDARLEDQFEAAYVANLLQGAELTRLVITGREDPSQPLVLRYDVNVGGFARRDGASLLVPPVFLAQLGPQLARVASRNIPQLIGGAIDLEVSVRVRLPEGMTPAALPAPVSLTGLGAEVEASHTSADGEIHIERRYHVPRMRVAPADYPTLARFSRAADEAEVLELRVE
ncbi:MAG: DUF3857 domain-containing protein [Sandaracinaceae bacterium]